VSGSSADPEILETEGLFTQGSQPVRTSAESVGVIFKMDSYDWSNGIRYHNGFTRPYTEVKLKRGRVYAPAVKLGPAPPTQDPAPLGAPCHPGHGSVGGAHVGGRPARTCRGERVRRILVDEK